MEELVWILSIGRKLRGWKERKKRAATLPASGGAKAWMESTLMHCKASVGRRRTKNCLTE